MRSGADTGLWLAGTSWNFMPKGYYGYSEGMYLLKIDSNGNVLWTENRPGYCCHNLILITNHSTDKQEVITIGDYVNSGISNGEIDCWDILGNLIWSKQINENNDETIYSLTEIKNGDIIIVGALNSFSTWSDTTSDPDGRLLDMGTAINVICINPSSGTNVYAEALFDSNDNSNPNSTLLYVNSVAPTKDGGFAITGGIGFTTPVLKNSALLVKCDSLGKIQWAKKSISIDSIGNSIIHTKDNGLAITGITRSKHIYLEKLDTAFNPLWEKVDSVSENDCPRAIAQTTDGGFIITGQVSDFNMTLKVYLAKFDSYGNLQWDKIIGGSNNDGGRSVIQAYHYGKTYPWGYVVAGFTHSFGYSPDSGNIYLVKTDTLGNSCNAISANGVINSTSDISILNTLNSKTETIYLYSSSPFYSGDSVISICESYVGLNNITSSNNDVSIYPNPFTTISTISFNEAGTHYLELDDITGRKLREMKCASNKYALNRDGLAQGIYLLKVFDDKMKYESSLKVVLQ